MERKPAFSAPIARAFLVTALLALAAALLAGCDLPLGTPEATAPTAEPELTATPEATPEYPPGVTPIIFWEPYALDRPQGILLSEMVRDFETENPDIVVEIVPKSGYIGIHGAMMAGIDQGGEAGSDLLPNLAVAFPSMIAEYAEAGVVAPLDGYLFDPEIGFSDEDWADIYTGTLEAGRLPGFGGQLLGRCCSGRAGSAPQRPGKSSSRHVMTSGTPRANSATPLSRASRPLTPGSIAAAGGNWTSRAGGPFSTIWREWRAWRWCGG